MRVLVAVVLLTTALAGCVGEPDLDPDATTGSEEPTILLESFRGMVLAANTPAVALSPDQAGDVERWFYVHEDTTNLTLDLRTNKFDLEMDVFPAGCHDWDCATEVRTEDRTATVTFDAPEAGPWEVVFFLAEEGAEEVYYELAVTREQTVMHDPEHEPYAGEVTAFHLGATRISPDQLGDVYREFWVHEGTTRLTIDFSATEDVYFVVGQSHPARDRGSEEGQDTEEGTLELVWDDPKPGGWYYIVFHESEGPGVAEVAYEVDVTKERGADAV